MLAIYQPFKEFGHIFWGATKRVIIMTDKNQSQRFFQAKIIPPPLWKACDFVLQVNFTMAHIPRKLNTAADFLFRLEMDPNDKTNRKIGEDIPTKRIELNIDSKGIAQEELIFLTLQTNTRSQKKFGSVKKKHEIPYKMIHLTSQSRVSTQITYTKTQEL